jgi:hypothetical protein
VRLQRVLESLGSVYGNEAADIGFGETLRVDVTRSQWGSESAHEFVLPARVGAYLDADLPRDEEYELLVDTLNHLSYCQRTNSWARTESFTAEVSHPASLGAFVHRMVEHAYVTSARLSEYRGLAGAYARRMDATFDGDSRVDNLRQDPAIVEGLRELAYTGRVAGLESAADPVRGTLSYAATELDRVRDPGVSGEFRDEVAERILRTLVDRMYHPRTARRHLRSEMNLPFQDTKTVFPDVETTDTTDADEGLTASDDASWVLFAPALPTFLMTSLFDTEEAVEWFYERVPWQAGILLSLPLSARENT